MPKGGWNNRAVAYLPLPLPTLTAVRAQCSALASSPGSGATHRRLDPMGLSRHLIVVPITMSTASQQRRQIATGAHSGLAWA